MTRNFFTLSAAVSLLLCAATVVMWVRSIFVQDQIYRIHRVYVDHDTAVSYQTTFVSANGSVGILRGREYVGLPRQLTDAEWPEAIKWSYSTRSAFEYRTAYGTNDFGFTLYSFGNGEVFERMWFVPIAPLPVIFAAIPIWWSIRERRRLFRLANNLCLTCSYSLTGNTSGVCPECGTAVAEKVEAKA